MLPAGGLYLPGLLTPLWGVATDVPLTPGRSIPCLNRLVPVVQAAAAYSFRNKTTPVSHHSTCTAYPSLGVLIRDPDLSLFIVATTNCMMLCGVV